MKIVRFSYFSAEGCNRRESYAVFKDNVSTEFIKHHLSSILISRDDTITSYVGFNIDLIIYQVFDFTNLNDEE